jgi:putative chitinase
MKGGATGQHSEGDGARYKGRGFSQLTGRANYADYSNALGVDLVNDPTLAPQPALSLKIAYEYLKHHNINVDCDRDDSQAVARKVAGGLTGLSERIVFTQRAKTAVARLQAVQLSGAASSSAARLDRLRRRRGRFWRADLGATQYCNCRTCSAM